MRVKSAPSTPYTITAYFDRFPERGNFDGLGLIFRDSGSGKFSFLGGIFNTFGGGNLLTVNSYSSVTAVNAALYSHDIDALGQAGKEPYWLRITDDGTDRKYYVSFDNGIDWELLYTEGRTTYFTADQVGWGANRRTAADWDRKHTLFSWLET